MRVHSIATERRNAAVLRRRLAALLIPLTLASGCASDVAPPGVTPASAAYRADLDSCHSAAATARGANTAEGFLTGALVGAAHGAVAGAHRGGADVGAIIGASVGAVVGFVHGLRWSRGTSVAACMQSKGYRRV